MLTPDRKKRITAEKILVHPWLKKLSLNGSDDGTSGSAALDPEVIKSLQRFKGQSKLKKAALNVLVKMLGPKDIQTLRE
jgi:hypothetical protein